MKAASVRSLYARIDGEERFRVLMRALAREDFAEANHLVATAPMTNVVARDPDLGHAYVRCKDLHANFATAVGPALGALLALEVVEPLLSNGAAQGFGPGAEAYSAELMLALVLLRVPAAGRVKAGLVALAELAEEQFGLSLETFLALAHPPIGSGLSRHREVIEAAEIGELEIEEARFALRYPEGGPKEGADAIRQP